MIRLRSLVSGLSVVVVAGALTACQPTATSSSARPAPSTASTASASAPSASPSPSPSPGRPGAITPLTRTASATPTSARPTLTVTPYGAVATSPTVYLVKVGAGSYGCGDTLVPAEPVSGSQTPVRDAISALLAKKGMQAGQSGLYNGLGQSSLTYVDGRFDAATGKVEVWLAGQVVTSGECDIPRVIGQLELTALSAAQATSVQVYLNDKPLKDALSLR